MSTIIISLALIALGFGLGRVKHASNLKLAKVKAELVKLESEAMTLGTEAKADVAKVVARVKALL